MGLEFMNEDRRVAQYAAREQGMDRPDIAWKIWFFLGVFGAHRIYLKRYISGALQFFLAACGFIFIGTPLWAPILGILGTWYLLDGLFVRAWAKPNYSGTGTYHGNL